MKALICSPETRGQFTGIINRQICHKWFHCCTNYKFKPHLITCFFIPPLPPLCSVVFAVLLIIIIKQIVFFWYDCYRRWQGKETQRRSQVFYSGRHVTVLTPLPRTGMFSKNWRAILDEVVRPEAPHWMNPQNLTSPSNNDTFLQNSTLKRACPIIDWWSEISKLLL